MIIGTGIDVVEIERFRRILERSSRDRFLQRVFTPEEQRFCLEHRDPVPNFAVRFAAKEAVFKALGTGWAKGVTWLDVEVCRQQAQAPTIVLHGEAQRLGSLMGAQKVHLSLSHTENWAVAMAILE